MTNEEALKAFENPRPNGWFRDDEVAAAREALREKVARENEAKPKRDPLNVIAAECGHASIREEGVQGVSTPRSRALEDARSILWAMHEKVVPLLRHMESDLTMIRSPVAVAKQILTAIGEELR